MAKTAKINWHDLKARRAYKREWQREKRRWQDRKRRTILDVTLSSAWLRLAEKYLGQKGNG